MQGFRVCFFCFRSSSFSVFALCKDIVIRHSVLWRRLMKTPYHGACKRRQAHEGKYPHRIGHIAGPGCRILIQCKKTSFVCGDSTTHGTRCTLYPWRYVFANNALPPSTDFFETATQRYSGDTGGPGNASLHMNSSSLRYPPPLTSIRTPTPSLSVNTNSVVDRPPVKTIKTSHPRFPRQHLPPEFVGCCTTSTQFGCSQAGPANAKPHPIEVVSNHMHAPAVVKSYNGYNKHKWDLYGAYIRLSIKNAQGQTLMLTKPILT